MKTSGWFFTAAALAALSLSLPLWEFRMSAPQYPDETLHVRVMRTGLTGDLQEVETLQKFIGVSFPADPAELALVTPGVLTLAALIGLAGLAGAGYPGRALRVLATIAVFGLLACSLVLVQMRLYEVGHNRAADAPVAGMKDFTPPAIGPITIANFTVWSYPHAGGLALALAGILTLVGTRRSFPRRDIAGAGTPIREPVS
jgi:hypothetical protein